MGLLTGILMLPLAPVRGVAWVGEVVREQAEREMAAAASPERALEELEVARATGQISPEEAEELESQLIDELLAARRAQGGG
jgi:hypothetical protein